MKEQIFSLLKNANTSYKYFFLLACIRNIEFDKMTYDFNYLSKMMVVEYSKFNCAMSKRLTKNDRLYDLIVYLAINYSEFFILRTDKEQYKMLNNIKDDYVQKALYQLVLYVPYRLIINEQFSKDLNGVLDRNKNKIIEFKSKEYDCLYKIEDKNITWNYKYYNYILNHKEDLITHMCTIINSIYDKVN